MKGEETKEKKEGEKELEGKEEDENKEEDNNNNTDVYCPTVYTNYRINLNKVNEVIGFIGKNLNKLENTKIK